jgi:ketosteroid isomerase-like protein
MRRYFLVVVGVFLVLAIVSMSSEAVAGSDEHQAAIDKIREMEAASVNNADSSSIPKIYSQDVEYIPPGEPVLKGTDAVREWHMALIEQFDADLEYTASDIKVMGDWAIEQYEGNVKMTPKAGGDPIVEQVRGIHVYRRGEDGTWKITKDIWNYHVP